MKGLARDVVQDESWMDRGSCTDLPPDLFFPGRHDPHATLEAKAVCAACPVREECLEYALNPLRPMVYGVWGGKSERERRQIRSARNRGEAA